MVILMAIMKRAVKGIGLDLEGTLINIERAHHEAHLRVLRDYGICLSLEEAIRKFPRFIGGPDEALHRDEIAPYIKEKTGKDCDVSELLQRKKKYYSEILPQLSVELRPGVKEAIKWFKKKGYGIVIGSVTDKYQAWPLLEKTGLLKLIGEEHIILRQDVDRPKPDPEVWQKAAQKLGIGTKELLVFDDSPGGMETAHQAGCLAVAMPVFYKPTVLNRLINAGAFRIFWDWREINLPALMENIERLK